MKSRLFSLAPTLLLAASLAAGLASCSLIEPDVGECANDSQCIDVFGIGHTCDDEGFCVEPDRDLLEGVIAADSCVSPDIPLLESAPMYIPVQTEAMADDFREFGGCVNAPMSGNDGFFKIEMVEDERWYFHLRNDTETANPGIFILPSCNSLSCQTATASDVCDAGTDEHLSMIAPRTGEYFIGIDTRDPGGGDFELLALKTTCGNGGALETGEACDDGNTTPGDGCDEFCRAEIYEDNTTEVEPNDGSPVANVVKIPGGVGTFTVNGRLGQRCDRDTFAVDVPEGGSVSATVTPSRPEACSPDAPAVRLVLCNPDGNSVRATAVAPDEMACPELTPEIVGTSDLPANRYYVRIRTSETAPRLDYLLNITVSGPE